MKANPKVVEKYIMFRDDEVEMSRITALITAAIAALRRASSSNGTSVMRQRRVCAVTLTRTSGSAGSRSSTTGTASGLSRTVWQRLWISAGRVHVLAGRVIGFVALFIATAKINAIRVAIRLMLQFPLSHKISQ
ncbi:hypothetical protein HG531_006443 [Fusarium graminearum]|nr:hypothetical protein HG531_006443 [Fusarium graminearum]